MFTVVAATLAAATVASAQCAPDCPVKGGKPGKDAATDCFAELGSSAVRLNYPGYNPAKPKPGKEIRCFDGEAGCDLDGVVNNECVFDINLCLRNPDPSLPDCTPADVTEVSISGTSKYPELASLQSAVDALLPATTNVCTTNQSVTVALKGPNSKGTFKAGKFQLKADATAGGVDKNKVKMVCMPHGWPSHGYDSANTRASSAETKIDSTNVASMVEKWLFSPPLGQASQQPNGVSITSTVTVGEKLLYTSSWNGRVYGVDKKKGKLKWTFDTGAKDVLGVQSTVTIAADGRVLVGDSLGKLFCLDGKKGTLLWEANAGSEDPAVAHAWASPTVANNRVFMGIASHGDAPCTRGTMVAYDLDTGAELWRQYTVPERICYDDTSNECSANTDCVTQGSPCLIGHCDSKPSLSCTVDGDCPNTFLNPGNCVTGGECWLERSISCTVDADCPACAPAIGGGITATPSVSPDGEDLYMASVGCLSFPSVGNSDSIFKVDAGTGAIDWVYRTEAPEQFQVFPGGPTYHDYGFLNGPILANVSDGGMGTVPVAVAGGKDGVLYAVNQTTGLLEWDNVLAPAPPFAGFGLFNGAVAYDAETDQFFAALYSISGYPSGNDHLLSFNGVDGTTGWSDQIGTSWSSVTVANDILFAGHNADGALFAYNKADGTLLHTFMLPAGQVSGGAAVVDGVLYVPYGDISTGNPNASGGVAAFELPALP